MRCAAANPSLYPPHRRAPTPSPPLGASLTAAPAAGAAPLPQEPGSPGFFSAVAPAQAPAPLLSADDSAVVVAAVAAVPKAKHVNVLGARKMSGKPGAWRAKVHIDSLRRASTGCLPTACWAPWWRPPLPARHELFRNAPPEGCSFVCVPASLHHHRACIFTSTTYTGMRARPP